jgi:hypothetical protein
MALAGYGFGGIWLWRDMALAGYGPGGIWAWRDMASVGWAMALARYDFAKQGLVDHRLAPSGRMLT